MLQSLRKLKVKGANGEKRVHVKYHDFSKAPMCVVNDDTSPGQSPEDSLQKELERTKLEAQQAIASVEAYTRENAHLTVVIRELYIEVRSRDAEIEKLRGELAGPKPGSDVVSLFTEKEAIREKLVEALEELEEEREMRNMAENERVVAESSIMELNGKLQEQMEMGEVLHAGKVMGNKRRTKMRTLTGSGGATDDQEVQKMLPMVPSEGENGGELVNLTREWVTVAHMEIELEKLQEASYEKDKAMAMLQDELKEAQAKVLALEEQEKRASDEASLQDHSSTSSIAVEMLFLKQQLNLRAEELLMERTRSMCDDEVCHLSEEKWLLQEEVQCLHKTMEKMEQDFEEERQVMVNETGVLRGKFEGTYKMLEEASMVFVREKRALLEETKKLQARVALLSEALDQAKKEFAEPEKLLSEETERRQETNHSVAARDHQGNEVEVLSSELEVLRQKFATRDAEATSLEERLAELAEASEGKDAALANLKITVRDMKAQRRALLDEAARSLGLNAAGEVTPCGTPRSNRGDGGTPRSARGDGGTPRSFKGDGTPSRSGREDGGPRFAPVGSQSLEQFNEDALLDEIAIVVDELNEVIAERLEVLAEVDRLKGELEEARAQMTTGGTDQSESRKKLDQRAKAALEEKEQKATELGRLHSGIEEWRIRAESLSTELASLWGQLEPLRKTNAQLETKLAAAVARNHELEAVVRVWEEREASWIVENSKLDAGLHKALEDAEAAKRSAVAERQSGEVLTVMLQEANKKKGEVIMRLQEAERVEKHLAEKLSLMEEELESIVARAEQAEGKLLEKRKLVTLLRGELRQLGVITGNGRGKPVGRDEWGGDGQCLTPVSSLECQLSSEGGEMEPDSPGVVGSSSSTSVASVRSRKRVGEEGASRMGQEGQKGRSLSGDERVGGRLLAVGYQRGTAESARAAPTTTTNGTGGGGTKHRHRRSKSCQMVSSLARLNSPNSPLTADLSISGASIVSNLPASPASVSSSTSFQTVESGQVAPRSPFWTPPSVSKPLPYRPRTPPSVHNQAADTERPFPPLRSWESGEVDGDAKLFTKASSGRPLNCKAPSVSPLEMGLRSQGKKIDRTASGPGSAKAWAW